MLGDDRNAVPDMIELPVGLLQSAPVHKRTTLADPGVLVDDGLADHASLSDPQRHAAFGLAVPFIEIVPKDEGFGNVAPLADDGAQTHEAVPDPAPMDGAPLADEHMGDPAGMDVGEGKEPGP
jgi:hypothetical protein